MQFKWRGVRFDHYYHKNEFFVPVMTGFNSRFAMGIVYVFCAVSVVILPLELAKGIEIDNFKQLISLLLEQNTTFG